jgi:sugar diacid utilization regulator
MAWLVHRLDLSLSYRLYKIKSMVGICGYCFQDTQVLYISSSHIAHKVMSTKRRETGI